MYVTTLAVFVYVLWRLFFTLPFQYGIPSMVGGVMLFCAEITSFIITLSSFREATHYVNPALPVIPLSWYPDVDLYVTTHNETVELMYKTINALTFLNYPDKSKVHVWLCDDNNRPEMKKLAEELGVGYFGMVGNKHAKAGNMNNAFWQTTGELVVTVDADMILRSNFLMETVPYFFLPRLERRKNGRWRVLKEKEIDPEYKVGFVQSPQSFYNPDLYQYNLYSEQNVPNEQDFFFTEVNVSKNHDNAAQYAGSNTVLSRQALEDIGGFATESITEDFLTGVMILQAGYRNFAIPEQLAHGLCPDTIGSLMSQRERWARGNVQVFKILRVFSNRVLDFWQKVELTATLCYWLGFIAQMLYMLAPILAVLFNIRVVDAPTWQILVFWLPYYTLFHFATKIFSSNTRTNHWSAVVDTIMAPYLTLPTIKEMLGIKQKKFVVTAKSKEAGVEHWRSNLYILPHAMLLVATVVSIFLLVRQSIIINNIYNPIVLFWLLVETKNLLFAIFFMMGRINYRSAERFFIHVPIVVECFGTQYNGRTADMSDNGLAAMFDTPMNIDSDSLVDVVVQTKRYTAYMKCAVVNVKRDAARKGNREWTYAFSIREIDEKSWRQYLQILYDRPHSLPKAFKENSSMFDDISTNLMRRTQRKEFNVRKMPRVNVELPFLTEEEYEGVLHDFNFEYARISINGKLEPTDTLTLYFGEGLDLSVMPSTREQISHGNLYKVVNWEEILRRPDFNDIMERWENLQNLKPASKPIGTGYITTPKATGGEEADEWN
ncbi:glycosyltransferase [Eubacteriales bacterium OttesenSCG-928-A19]|nr:glycosyltransferase [Eubacteriales bacterium OttesenSCG-928-A19]